MRFSYATLLGKEALTVRVFRGRLCSEGVEQEWLKGRIVNKGRS